MITDNNSIQPIDSSKLDTAGLLREIVTTFRQNDEIYSRLAKVVSVDLTKATCEVEVVDGATYEDVQLQTTPTENGVICVPEVGSHVYVSFYDETTCFVSMYSEVTAYTFKNGENGGLVKIVPLLEALNTVQRDLNTLKQAFTSWAVVPTDGGAALKTVSSSWASQLVTETTRNDLENTEFKH